MPTKFSQFIGGGAPIAGDIVVGLRGGVNTQFQYPALPTNPWSTLFVGQPLFIDEGYVLANAAPAVYTLPTVAAVGQIIQLVCVTAAQSTIQCNVGQGIAIGNLASTLGVGGSINSTSIGDSITLVCVFADFTFVSLGGPQGNWNIT